MIHSQIELDLPDLVMFSLLEEILLLLPLHLQGVDESTATVQRVSGYQDKSGLKQKDIVNDEDRERRIMLAKFGGSSDLSTAPPLAVHQLLQLEGGLRTALAHPGDVARHPDVTIRPVARQVEHATGQITYYQLHVDYPYHSVEVPEACCEIYLVDQGGDYGERGRCFGTLVRWHGRR